MGNDNENNNNSEVGTAALHNLMFFIIIVLLCIILFVCVKTYGQVSDKTNIGSLKHYDSLYSEREGHISMNQAGDITGYYTPDGTQYKFEEPIPSGIFYN